MYLFQRVCLIVLNQRVIYDYTTTSHFINFRLTIVNALFYCNLLFLFLSKFILFN